MSDERLTILECQRLAEKWAEGAVWYGSSPPDGGYLIRNTQQAQACAAIALAYATMALDRKRHFA